MGEKRGKRGLLERLREGPVVGDGSMVFTLEKRGYVLAGHWTPEAVIEYPDAVRQLSREYLRAGADVIQSCTFYSGDDRLNKHKTEAINDAACFIASEVVKEGDALVCGCISPTRSFSQGQSKELVQAEVRKQVEIFITRQVDFLLAEFFQNIVEVEYVVDVLKELGVPVAITMSIGPAGDENSVSPAMCGLRMGRTGADVIGLNCQFDGTTCIETIKIMKGELDREGLTPYLMIQPIGFHAPDVKHRQRGYAELPEFPLALEPRSLTRWEARRFAREAYEAGVRYIGGCCGFEPHHIREIAEELAEERRKRPLGCDKNEPFGDALKKSSDAYAFLRQRRGKNYWMTMNPSTGRVYNPAFTPRIP